VSQELLITIDIKSFGGTMLERLINQLAIHTSFEIREEEKALK
jgi:hypothetical protein